MNGSSQATACNGMQIYSLGLLLQDEPHKYSPKHCGGIKNIIKDVNEIRRGVPKNCSQGIYLGDSKSPQISTIPTSYCFWLLLPHNLQRSNVFSDTPRNGVIGGNVDIRELPGS